MPARNGHTAVLYQANQEILNLVKEVISDKHFALIFGGIDHNGLRYNDLWLLSLPSFDWVNISSKISGDIPTPRAGHSSVIYGDRMYIFGGEDARGNSKDFMYLDLKTLEWKKVESYGNHPDARSFHSSDLIPPNANDKEQHPKIAIFGGYTDEGFTNEVALFDLALQKWERPTITTKQRNAEPDPRQGASMIYALGRLWIFGGYSTGQFYGDMYTLNIQNFQWTNITKEIQGELPSPRQLASIVYSNNQISEEQSGSIFISGGCNYFQKECYSNVYEFTLKDSWISQIDQENALKAKEGDKLINFGSLIVKMDNQLWMRESTLCIVNVMKTILEMIAHLHSNVKMIAQETDCAILDFYASAFLDLAQMIVLLHSMDAEAKIVHRMKWVAYVQGKLRNRASVNVNRIDLGNIVNMIMTHL
eukprot:403373320